MFEGEKQEAEIYCKFCKEKVPAHPTTTIAVHLKDFHYEKTSEIFFCAWCNNYGITLDGKREWFRDGYF